MLKLIKEVLRTGEATLAYPFQPMEQMPGFRGKPQHDPERCIACAACALACPPNALSMASDLEQGTITWSLFMGRCIYCGRCEEVCPTGAILLSPDFELAVMNKDDLFERADYRLAVCPNCGTSFAPKKQLDYVAAVLEQSGMGVQELSTALELLRLCPDCKRRNDAPRVIELHREEV
jgi:hydrogenase-4 component H